MNLGDLLFPGLLDYQSECIPDSIDSERPWKILSKEILQDQILKKNGGDGIFIHEEAIIGKHVEIEGPCYIGPRVEIRHGAFLRKGSWICEGSIVGHSSEVKNSILLPGASLPHFNYVGDSIVGFDANLGAGVKISNVRNDRRSIRIRLKDGSIIETELKKLGSLIGDGAQIGCNAVANPGTVIEPKSMVDPGTVI